MLEIRPVTHAPNKDDYCIVYAGNDTVQIAGAAPGELWLRRDVETQFAHLNTELPVGYWQSTPCYAVSVSADQLDMSRHLPLNLFGLLGRIDDDVFALHGRAHQILSWRQDHRFCGRCGGEMAFSDGGRALECAPCRLLVYPRLHPCVIVAVGQGDKLLLAAAKGRRINFYSTLAGFIEPGETAEEAVAREVKEEVGIEVTNVRYFASQPWPFPSQLMLGYLADYAGGELVPDEEEIEDAGWFSPEDLPPIPPNWSIAGRLIEQFFNERAQAR